MTLFELHLVSTNYKILSFLTNVISYFVAYSIQGIGGMFGNANTNSLVSSGTGGFLGMNTGLGLGGGGFGQQQQQQGGTGISPFNPVKVR